MRVSLFIAAVAGLTAFSASAQEQGQYSAGLSRMLSATAAGTCPADVMGEQLLAACNVQIAQMAPAIAALGAVQSVTFVESRTTPEFGRVEVYRVVFAGGQTMTWHIGGESNGKFNMTFSQG